MEDKRLNFAQPLLSTRRYPSTASNSESENGRKKTDNALSKVPPLPKYKSELKSGPVRNPGTVPFVWEQMPGRPKNEGKPQTADRECHAITAPKLPPGKIFNVKQETLDGVSKGTAVNHSQGKIDLVNSQNVQSVDKIITKEVRNEVEPEEAGCSYFEDDNSVYVDAVDTLSRCESFFMTCSISGVSGLDGADFRLPETYQTDPQARDFMIGRFLPAAKAMASEMPQHSDRRHLVPKEHQTDKTVTVPKWRPPNPYRPSNLSNYVESEKVEDSDDDDYDDDDYDAADGTSHKLCGLLPRLCLQNSFCLLNPVPGIRKQPELPIKSVRTRNLKSANVSSHEIQNKGTPIEKRFSYGPQARGIHDKNQPKHGSNQLSCKNDHKKLGVSSPFRDLQNKGVNAYHKERANKEIGFLGIPEKAQIAKGNNRVEKDGSNLQELLLNESSEWAASSASSQMVERTLYVDSVHTLKPKSSNFGSSDMSTPDYNGNEVQMLPKGPKIEVNVPVDSVVLDSTQSDSVPEKSAVRPESIKSPDYHSLSSSDISVNDVQLGVTDGFAHCKIIGKDSFKSPYHKVDEGRTGLESQLDAKLGNSVSIHDIHQNPVTVASSKFIDSEMIYLDCRFPVRTSDRGSSDSCNILRPLPPPLPKSPSESWLKRALPAVASRSSSKPPFATSIDPPKTHNFDPKWEIIVRTTNVQVGHVRLSEELLTPIPEA